MNAAPCIDTHLYLIPDSESYSDEFESDKHEPCTRGQRCNECNKSYDDEYDAERVFQDLHSCSVPRGRVPGAGIAVVH